MPHTGNVFRNLLILVSRRKENAYKNYGDGYYYYTQPRRREKKSVDEQETAELIKSRANVN